MSPSSRDSRWSGRGRMLFPKVHPIGESSNDEHSHHHDGSNVAICHTLISSRDDHLQTFGFLPAELSCLTPIVVQSIRFFYVSEGNVQNTQKEGKRALLGHFSAPEPPR